MKITLAKTLILDREAVFMVIADHFRAKGYDVANIIYETDEHKRLTSAEVIINHEELKYE